MNLLFSYPALLWGLTAAAIPLLIHLLRRRQATEQPLPTMRFLAEAHKKRLMNIQLQDLLLLILRTLLILILVLALAGPRITWSGGLGRLAGWMGGTTARRVILIDASQSMQYREPDGLTRFDRALESAAALLDELPDSTEVLVAAFSDGGPEDERQMPASFSSDASYWKRQLELFEPSNRPARMDWAIDRALHRLEDAADAGVFLLTDLQAVSWESVLGRAHLQSAGQAPLSVVDVSRGPSRNIWISAIDLPALPVGRSELNRLQVELMAAGYDEAEPLSVRLQFEHLDPSVAGEEDGLPVERLGRELTLESGQPTTVSLPFSATDEHVLHGRLRIEPVNLTDPHEADNLVHLEMPVFRDISVLVLFSSGQQIAAYRQEQHQAESHFLRTCLTLALDASGVESASSWLNHRMLDPREESLPDLDDTSVVIVYGRPGLDRDGYDRLDRYVREGGSLLLLADPEWPDGAGMEPELSDWLSGMGLAWSKQTFSSGPAALALVADGHPAWRVFRQRERSLFDAVRLWEVTAIHPTASETVLAEARVPDATVSRIFPVITERSVESGRVMLCGVPLRREGSNLATSALWVPMLQQLIKSLAVTPGMQSRTSLSPEQSDLTRLRDEDRQRLEQEGRITFSRSGETAASVARTTGSRDLTGLLLGMGLLLAMGELFLGNSLR